MQKLSIWILSFMFSVLLWSCSKKIHPTQTATNAEGTVVVEKEDSAVVEKEKVPVVKSEPKNLFPKVITVNDSVAQKSVDGRLYYDVMNHRYWKNYKDGKYYLYNKSMYKNPDFKPRNKK